MYSCNNCAHVAPRDEMNAARDLLCRLEVGDVFTDKECPECGALAHPVDEPEEVADPVTYPTIWSDQPKIVTSAKPILTINVETRIVEVRRQGGTFYVSLGNLFGSQTVKTDYIDKAFHLVELAAKLKNKDLQLPEGCEQVLPD